MKIWLDDYRPEPINPKRDIFAPYDCVCLTAQECIDIVSDNKATFISFDHDLGPGLTGYDVAKYIEKGAHEGWLNPIRFKVHSANPVGAEKIVEAMNSAWRIWIRDGKVEVNG